MRKSGRCFVAVVDIEADKCAVCLAELDAVQSEADRQEDVCARRLSGRVGGQATNNLPTFFHYLFVLADLRLTWMFHTKQLQKIGENS